MFFIAIDHFHGGGGEGGLGELTKYFFTSKGFLSLPLNQAPEAFGTLTCDKNNQSLSLNIYLVLLMAAYKNIEDEVMGNVS